MNTKLNEYKVFSVIFPTSFTHKQAEETDQLIHGATRVDLILESIG